MPLKLSKPGISAWEVFIVLVCIIIVVVFFVPLIQLSHSAGDKRRQGTCMTNMRQISTGLMMTAQDAKDVMPAANEWMVKSGEGNAFYDCPSNKFTASRTTPDYMYVAAFFHNQHGLLSKRKLNSIKDTTLTPELVELIDPDKPGQTPYVSDASKMSDDHYGYNPQVALLNKIDRFRHDGGSIVAFVDGHVEYLKAKKVNMMLLKNAMTEHEPVIK